MGRRCLKAGQFDGGHIARLAPPDEAPSRTGAQSDTGFVCLLLLQPLPFSVALASGMPPDWSSCETPALAPTRASGIPSPGKGLEGAVRAESATRRWCWSRRVQRRPGVVRAVKFVPALYGPVCRGTTNPTAGSGPPLASRDWDDAGKPNAEIDPKNSFQTTNGHK